MTLGLAAALAVLLAWCGLDLAFRALRGLLNAA